jgi:CheY-like chemotaxis protein
MRDRAAHPRSRNAALSAGRRGFTIVPPSPFGVGSADHRACAGGEGERLLENRTILIVEDEDDLRELLADTFALHGARVCSAANAEDALAALDGVRADALISDIGLQGTDGLALIAKVRERDLERGGAVPAVALTGHTRDEDRERVLDAGYQLHVGKPIDLGQLVLAVARLLG